ncbi:helix-turn-helix domain-containing protein [Actinomyces howellii]|uniref:helix-turn-helix domain-containing protein n=1 Tax=Actinomyces howellii TaxID=52771 RepID=UPI000F82D48B
MSDQNMHGRASSSADDLLTTAAAAKRLRCTTTTVRRWARAGRVPAVVLPSGRMLFRPADIDRLLEPRVLSTAASSSADKSADDEEARGQAMLSWPGTPQPSPASPAAAEGAS